MANRPTPNGTAAMHPRGVFQDEHAFDGVVVYKVYDCSGMLVETAMIAARWNDADIARELAESLDRRCPSGEHCHPIESLALPPLHLL